MKAALTLGPLLFHWEPEKRRDFYFRIADEAPLDCVYLGETVCSKRAPFFAPYRDAVIERLQKAGKQVVLSSLALMTLPREVETLKEDAAKGLMLEANDAAVLQVLKQMEQRGGDKRPFVVGPTINVLNEGTLACLSEAGAQRVVFASEMKGEALKLLAGKQRHVEKEVQVFGRQALAVSMRCYHARAVGRDKDHCRFACAADPDGLAIQTLTEQKILTVNGVQTMSSGYLVLLEEMLDLRGAGITHFRLSPQDVDMVTVARLYRALLDGKRTPREVRSSLTALCGATSFINGFYHGREGLACVEPETAQG